MIFKKQHICSLDEWRHCYDIISGNIDFDTVYAKDIGAREQVEEFIKIMTDVVCSNASTVRVNGEVTKRELVETRLYCPLRFEMDSDDGSEYPEEICSANYICSTAERLERIAQAVLWRGISSRCSSRAQGIVFAERFRAE